MALDNRPNTTSGARELYQSYIREHYFRVTTCGPYRLAHALHPIVRDCLYDPTCPLDTLRALCAFLKTYLEPTSNDIQ